MWREDGRCGPKFKQPNGADAECRADSDKPCCNSEGYCGATPDYCDCQGCVNYGNQGGAKCELLVPTCSSQGHAYRQAVSHYNFSLGIKMKVVQNVIIILCPVFITYQIFLCQHFEETNIHISPKFTYNKTANIRG